MKYKNLLSGRVSKVSLTVVSIFLAQDSLIALSAPVPGEIRTWTSAKGDKIEAAYVGFENNIVEIRNLKNGKTNKFHIDKLSPEDQIYLLGDSSTSARRPEQARIVAVNTSQINNTRSIVKAPKTLAPNFDPALAEYHKNKIQTYYLQLPLVQFAVQTNHIAAEAVEANHELLKMGAIGQKEHDGSILGIKLSQFNLFKNQILNIAPYPQNVNLLQGQLSELMIVFLHIEDVTHDQGQYRFQKYELLANAYLAAYPGHPYASEFASLIMDRVKEVQSSLSTQESSSIDDTNISEEYQKVIYARPYREFNEIHDEQNDNPLPLSEKVIYARPYHKFNDIQIEHNESPRPPSGKVIYARPYQEYREHNNDRQSERKKLPKKFKAMGTWFQIKNLIWSGESRIEMTAAEATHFCGTLGAGSRLAIYEDFEPARDSMGYPDEYDETRQPEFRNGSYRLLTGTFDPNGSDSIYKFDMLTGELFLSPAGSKGVFRCVIVVNEFDNYDFDQERADDLSDLSIFDRS